MADKWIVVATAPDGEFRVTQAKDEEEAVMMQLYAKAKYPTVDVKIRRAKSGLAIFEGLMDELLK